MLKVVVDMDDIGLLSLYQIFDVFQKRDPLEIERRFKPFYLRPLEFLVSQTGLLLVRVVFGIGMF